MSIESQLISKERERATFTLEELTNIYDGSEDETRIRRKVGK